MASSDALTSWLPTEEGDYGDYYRDTLGGRQTLTKVDTGQWELTQEGYLGVMHSSVDQQDCIRYANQMAGVECLRIAGKDAPDFANGVFYQVASIIKHLCSGDADRAEDGLKEVSQLEASLLILRHRLNQRTATQSTAARAEEVGAMALRLITMFYGELMFGQLDLAANKVAELRELADEMQAEVSQIIGKPENMA